MKFSVVVPAHNRPDLVSRALVSVLSQSYEDFEVILIDDASTEPFDDLLSSLGDPRIKLLRSSRNIGGAAARNLGIDVATGDYVAFLDSDDYWDSRKLKVCNEALQASSESVPILIHSSSIKKIDKTELALLSQDEVKRFSSFFEYIVIGNGLLQTSALVVNSALVKRVKFRADLKKHQDLQLYIDLRGHFKKSVFLPEPLSTWDISHEQGSISRGGQVLESVQWIKANRADVGDKSYYQYILKFIYAKNILSLGGVDFWEVLKGVVSFSIPIVGFCKYSLAKWARFFLVKDRSIFNR